MSENINILTEVDFINSGQTYQDVNTDNSDFIVVRVIDNVDGAMIYQNGNFSGNLTPTVLTISKEDVIRNPYQIEVRKQGYYSNTKYLVYAMADTNTNVLDLDQYKQMLNTQDVIVRVKKYVNDVEVPFGSFNVNGNYVNLEFELLEGQGENASNVIVNIYSNKNGISVYADGNVSYPTKGNNSYTYKSNTTFLIESSDASKYRIYRIEATPMGGTPDVIESASELESLRAEIVANQGYDVFVELTEVDPLIANETPRVELLSAAVKTVNINGGDGIPIVVRKNQYVKSITVATNTDVIEFDNLGSNDIIALKLPTNLFGELGQVRVSVYPLSLSEYYNINSGSMELPNVLTFDVDNIIERNVSSSFNPDIKSPYDLPIVPNIPNSSTIPAKGNNNDGMIVKYE